MTGSADLTVRTMRPDEFDEMRDMSAAAFDDPTIATLLDTLRDSWGWRDELSFVAELGGELVGQVLYNPAFLDARERIVDVLVLSPVAVRLDLQRTGIGARMITESLQVLAATRTEPLVFLEGHPSYYPRVGFQRASALGFTAPSVRIPDPAFMVYPLPSWEPAWQTGALVYPDAFWREDAVGLRPELS